MRMHDGLLHIRNKLTRLEGIHSSGVEGPVKTGLDPGPKGDLGPKEEQDPEDQDPEVSSDPEDGVE